MGFKVFGGQGFSGVDSGSGLRVGRVVGGRVVVFSERWGGFKVARRVRVVLPVIVGY